MLVHHWLGPLIPFIPLAMSNGRGRLHGLERGIFCPDPFFLSNHIGGCSSPPNWLCFLAFFLPQLDRWMLHGGWLAAAWISRWVDRLMDGGWVDVAVCVRVPGWSLHRERPTTHMRYVSYHWERKSLLLTHEKYSGLIPHGFGCHQKPSPEISRILTWCLMCGAGSPECSYCKWH